MKMKRQDKTQKAKVPRAGGRSRGGSARGRPHTPGAVGGDVLAVDEVDGPNAELDDEASHI